VLHIEKLHKVCTSQLLWTQLAGANGRQKCSLRSFTEYMIKWLELIIFLFTPGDICDQMTKLYECELGLVSFQQHRNSNRCSCSNHLSLRRWRQAPYRSGLRMIDSLLTTETRRGDVPPTRWQASS